MRTDALPDSSGDLVRWHRRFHRALLLSICVAATGLASCTGVKRDTPLIADGSDPLIVMSFAPPFSLDPMPAGWSHRKFFLVTPMDISLEQHAGKPAIRMATRNSASMLYRFTDVPLAAYPSLQWDWLVEKPIDSPIDETTEAGDDHPARIYLKFETATGQTHAMELIWGNRRLKSGDWKYLGDPKSPDRFPHYVVRGGQENVGRWHSEKVNLQNLYETQWGNASGARLIELALFCDTDATGAASVAYFSGISMAASD